MNKLFKSFGVVKRSFLFPQRMSFADTFKDKEKAAERVYVDEQESKLSLTLGKLMKKLLEKLAGEKKDTQVTDTVDPAQSDALRVNMA